MWSSTFHVEVPRWGNYATVFGGGQRSAEVTIKQNLKPVRYGVSHVISVATCQGI